MRISFPGFQRKKYPLTEGKDYSVLDVTLPEGKALVPRSLPMLHAIGVVMNNCLRHGESGNWYGYDRYLTDDSHRFAVLLGADGDMHVFLHATYMPREGKFGLASCVGKRNAAPEPGYHEQVYAFIRQQGWIFDESCNRAEGNDPQMARDVETYHKTLRMLFIYRDREPVRMPLPQAKNAYSAAHP